MSSGRTSFGEPEPLGVTPSGEGVNVAVFSANASAIEFCVFEDERETRRVRLRGRIGDVFHDFIAGVAPGARYGLRAYGPFLPGEGHCFNPAKLLVDPYAKAIDRPFALHASMFGYRAGAANQTLSMDDTDSAPFMPKGIVVGRGISRMAARPLTPWPETVLYELHVRGFTMRHPGIPEAIRGRFAGLAHPASIEHLVRLGITTVEIMPAAAWIDERHLAPLGLRNYWGYNPVALMAPDPGLAPGGWDEIRTAVAALTAAGIETILDVVLNHSGEGDALGPTVSLRGLDNATYYRSLPGAPWRHADDAGCGNTLALDRPGPLRLAMDALREWAERTGIHGFRFDLATTLGRRDHGFDPGAPLLTAIAQDPVLRDLKLIAEPWDVGPGGYQVGAFPASWGEWNDRFRDDVRRFWRGDPGRLGDLATRLAGSRDLFGARGVASRSINFVVAHDGFTLADLVSYSHKVNAANGENNRDGTDANFAWNNGVEGPSADPAVAAGRIRDQRALLATLILSRGTPMLPMGAEFGQSQAGNNNAYAQDNQSAWLDWTAADAGLIEWTRRLLRIRRDHPVLHGDSFLTGMPRDVSLLPDVEWRDAAGRHMTPEAWQTPDGNTMVMILADGAETGDTTYRVSVILHRGFEITRVALPPPRAGYVWNLIADSAADARSDDSAVISALEPPHHDPELVRSADGSGQLNPHRVLADGPGDTSITARECHRADTDLSSASHAADSKIHSGGAEAGTIVTDATISVAARSVVVLVERAGDRRMRIAADPALLHRLAHAAGIAPEWWDVSGRLTLVNDDTRRALLKAMRMPATTEGEARDALRQISDDRDRRELPNAVVLHSGEPAVLRLGIEPGLGRRPTWLTIQREDGETERVRLRSEEGILAAFTGVDGLPAQAWRVNLPVLPEGRHRLWREDAPDVVCHVTVAPRRCYLPEAIRRGARRFGISAQLYALRRANDQGIGDFTTLALLARAAKREGAATIGINPLHMLFPGDRERASPYHPSDRRFLDPIYLDVGDGTAHSSPDANRAFNRVAASGTGLTNDLVAYSTVWAAKVAVLERWYVAFAAREAAGSSAAADFQRFVENGGADLWRFAVFQAISEARPGETWRRWPDGLRSPDSETVKAFAREHAGRVRFHQYLQFLADRQLSAAAASGLELGLYRDLAVGAAPDGAEAWARSDDLAQGAWTGAPPDPIAPEGQNWHLPPPLPRRFQQNGFASFASLIGANMRHAGVLRIDHAMGLSRLFWIPNGATGAEGAYVSYPCADLLGQLALESARAKCMVVGEDLGTVPDGFRPMLNEADILSYRVLLLERVGRGFRPASSYPGRAVACVTTHDLPPLAGWWEGADIRERGTLGLLPDVSGAEEERRAERVVLANVLAREGCLAPAEAGNPTIGAVVRGAHEFVASTTSDLVFVQTEDLAGMRVGVNLPGTDSERPNWRLRLPEPIEVLLAGETAQAILGAVRASGRGTAGLDHEVEVAGDEVDPIVRQPA